MLCPKHKIPMQPLFSSYYCNLCRPDAKNYDDLDEEEITEELIIDPDSDTSTDDFDI